MLALIQEAREPTHFYELLALHGGERGAAWGAVSNALLTLRLQGYVVRVKHRTRTPHVAENGRIVSGGGVSHVGWRAIDRAGQAPCLCGCGVLVDPTKHDGFTAACAERASR